LDCRDQSLCKVLQLARFCIHHVLRAASPKSKEHSMLPCRDQSLYKVFQLALTALRHLHGTATEEKLKEQASGADLMLQ